MSSNDHSVSLKISLMICSSPSQPTQPQSHLEINRNAQEYGDRDGNEHDTDESDDCMDVQVKVYTLSDSDIVYKVNYHLLQTTHSTSPTSALLPQHTSGSSAFCYIIHSTDSASDSDSNSNGNGEGEGRRGLERFIECVHLLKDCGKNAVKVVIVLISPATAATVNDDDNDDDGRGRGNVINNEIKRHANECGIVYIEILAETQQQQSSSSSSSASRTRTRTSTGDQVLNKIFTTLIPLLHLSPEKMYTDPAFHLGKNVNLSEGFVGSEGFLMRLFNSPS